MRICFWSTTFQADNLALAYHLAAQPDVEVTVASESPELVRAGSTLLAPFAGEIVDRRKPDRQARLTSRNFDVVVLDNHVPTFALAPRVFVLWHGFGWRIDDLKTMRKELSKLVGAVEADNPHFRWQAFGEWDRQYRVEHSRLASRNVHALGAPYSDWLLPTSPARKTLARTDMQRFYSVPLERKLVLLGLTWHHGGSLGHWGDEETLLTRLFQHIEQRGACTLLRMHDRARYQRGYVRLVERLSARFARSVMLKWKDSSPDSLADLLLADVCISNYSSLLNAYYYSERPSIHIDPHDAAASNLTTFKMFMGLPMRRSVRNPEQLWKLPPDQNGGLRAQSFEQLLDHVDTALATPTCCAQASRSFVARYVTDANGASCARTERFLRAWVSGSDP